MPQPGRRPRWLVLLEQNILVRLATYYIVVAAMLWALWLIAPEGVRTILSTSLSELRSTSLSAGLEDTFRSSGKPRVDPAALISAYPSVTTAMAVTGAFLLVLPVAWVYMFTRQKRGYSPSLAQSLILLPISVAGVVVLVKNSLALAFSLAGIVAAVRFRNTLEDSRDAVFIFAVTGLGLAAAVHVDVAVVFSLLFNAIVLAMWHYDFALTPPRLEADRAERHLERAMAVANRTSQFVARVDQEILEALAPEQLDALAVRVRRHRERSREDLPVAKPPKWDARLLVHCFETIQTRAAVEPILDRHVKRWQFLGSRDGEGGTAAVEYQVRFRKSVAPHVVTEAMTRDGAPLVIRVEMDAVAAP
jgi:uncharacterized protein DUF4956